ncbi:MAG: hypothetical protein HQK76_00830 [Desulfobacterales bacterium]|nr:hypothetical protein [Desulfobacterales bacterium]
MSEIIGKIFSELIGKPSWNVKKGHGSFITFEFGKPFVEIGEVFETSMPFKFTYQSRHSYVHGEWHLWIYMCNWIVSYKDNEICHSESEDLEIHRACGFLNGQSIKSVSLNPDGSTCFLFDLNGCLLTIPYAEETEPNDTWLLYRPDNKVFSLRSDQHYCYSHKNSESEDEKYYKLK